MSGADYTATPTRNVLDSNGVPYAPSQSQTVSDPTGFLLDREWVKQAFMIAGTDLQHQEDILNRYWSTASAKYTTATMGGNIGINNRPQYTRYCDIRDKGRLPGRNDVSLSNTSGNYGMGRYYSEAIDDNAQKIFMRFGVAQFNSLTNFFLNAASPEASMMARTGRVSASYQIGKAIGTIGIFIAFPVISTIIFGGKAISKLFYNNPTSRYYSVKPTMEMYWSAVNTLVNTIGVNKGLIPSVITDTLGGDITKINTAYTFDQQELKQLSAMFPGIMDPAGYFDVYAIAARPQALANQLFEADYKNNYGASKTATLGLLHKADSAGNSANTYTNNSDGKHSLRARINAMLTFGSYYTDGATSTGANNTPGVEMDPRAVTNPSDPNAASAPNTSGSTDTGNTNTVGGTGSSFMTQALDYLDSNFRNGAEFAVFQVDFTGSVSESFSNSVTESSLQSTINSTSSEARQARFSIEDGNLVGGLVGSALGTVVNTVKDVALGALDGATFGLGPKALSALGILAGNGYIDVPKMWDSSTASLPRSTYTMQLVSPYGNVVSQMTNIYIPLCMILAGALPLSTGKQSYTSPFLVQLWDRGRAQIQVGIIDSLSITRGVSNLPFTNLGSPLAIDVSFSVMDLSSIMHMPVSTGSLFGYNAATDSDNILMDYLAVLAGQDIYSQIYALPRAKLNLAKQINNFKVLKSPAYWASVAHQEVTAGMMSYVTGPVANALEGAVAGNSVVVNSLSN